MPDPTTRILAMLELLQAHHQLTGTALATRLGVDVRTVRRYASRLVELGIPVVAGRGRHGGYRLMPGYKLPPLMFTDDEASAVVLGLMAGRRLGLTAGGPDGTPDPSETALAKVHRVLPAALRDRIEALRGTLDFTVPARQGPTPSTEAVLALAAAARDRRRVRIAYRSFRGADSERDLDPYGLVFHAGRWYVSGHDHRSGQVRTFRVDRVGPVRPGSGTFEVPAGHDPVAHVTQSLAGVPYAHEVEVTLATTLAEAQRRIPATIATLAAVPEGVLLRGRAEHLDGMAQVLAGLGWPFVIHRPAALRDAVGDLSMRLADWAARDTASGA